MYSCNQCGKTFTTDDSLKRHTKLHYTGSCNKDTESKSYRSYAIVAMLSKMILRKNPFLDKYKRWMAPNSAVRNLNRVKHYIE